MQNHPPLKISNSRYRIGLALLLLSAAVFFLPDYAGMSEDSMFGIFAINFLVTIVYFFMLMGTGAFKIRQTDTRCRFIFLILFLISAYSLNRTISVFEESATWLGILLVVVSAAYLALPYLHRFPLAARQIITGITGIAILLWTYLTIYLVPIYPLSVAAIPGFGISLHSFVPLLLLFFTIHWAIKAIRGDGRLGWGLGGGMLAAALPVIIFCAQWTGLKKVTARSYQHSLLDDNTDLPPWVKVSRDLADNWVTERFLKGSLVYTIFDGFDEFGFGRMPSRSMNEVRKHDPFVMIASMFSGVPPLNEADRIRILESKYDARHKTEERLWNGAHLRTTGIITNANIWPKLHLAYTEQIITVANKARKDRWLRGREEAIYTFQLPEGSAVTSLSLWIDGKESKAILTTKGKADSAYKQIVGVEQRDPSVVHWAEGNRVSLRVFPVMAGENRVFKIGVTTPLVRHNGRLIYQPVKFEGPRTEDALATTQLAIDGAMQHESGLNGFIKDERGRYKREGSYDEAWQLSFDAPVLQESAFSFNGYSYALQPYSPQRIPVTNERIYLDLNKSWTRNEFNAVYDLAKGRKLYACTDDIIRLTDENKEAVFKIAQQSDFSLFPLFSIKDPASALLITKGTERSPNVKDLAGSGFAAKLEAGLAMGGQIRLFNLGGELSPYLKTLKEHRAFRYEHGSLEDLRGLVSKNEFAAYPETDSSIVIEDAAMRITKLPGAGTATGPDHLLRLFAYNHLIQHLGKSLYTNMEGDSALAKEASEAYVVSPISSLIVLESAADYERFGIKDDASSLKNASVNSSGAVPEPHEWALIIIAAGVLIWMRFRRRLPSIKVAGK